MSPQHDDGDLSATAPMGQRLERQVHDGLLTRIRNGSYKLGQRLPSEIELAREYGVSRPVVRSALARLRESGLVKSRQGAGSFVCNGEHEHPPGFGPLGSIEDFAQYFSYRRLIECEAAAMAARRVDSAGMRQLHDILEEMEQLIEAEHVTIDPDVRFHHFLAELSGNRFLVDSLEMLHPHMVFIGKFVRDLGRDGYRKGKRAMSSEHRDILAAIEAHDPEAASAAMQRHLESSERRIFKGQ